MVEKKNKPERYNYEQQENYIDSNMDEPIIEDGGDVDTKKFKSSKLKPVEPLIEDDIRIDIRKRKSTNDANFDVSEEEYYQMSESMFQDRAEDLVKRSERLFQSPDPKRTYKETNYSEKIKYVNALKMFLTSLLNLEEIAQYVGYELSELEELCILNKWDKVKNDLYPHLNQRIIDYLEKNTTSFILKYDNDRAKATKRLGNYITSLAFSEIRTNPGAIRARDLLAAASKFSEYQVELELRDGKGEGSNDDEAVYSLLLGKGSKIHKALPQQAQEVSRYIASQQDQAEFAEGTMDIEIIE